MGKGFFNHSSSNKKQLLDIDGNNLSISGGNTVQLPGGANPNIIEEPTLAGFKFRGENVYSIYVEGANFETSKLSDYNIGIGVEVHRANVLDACGNSQGVVFYYTLGDN